MNSIYSSYIVAFFLIHLSHSYNTENCPKLRPYDPPSFRHWILCYKNNNFLGSGTFSWGVYNQPITETPSNNVVEPVLSNLPDLSRCGIAPETRSFATSTIVSPGEFPWLVAIFSKSGNKLRYRCNGNLVSNKHVVTAAHCLYDDEENRISKKKLFFLLGKVTIPLVMEKNYNLLNAAEVWIREDYESVSGSRPMADLAVIQLKKRVKFSNYVKPICLWELNDSEGIRNAKVVGWGQVRLDQVKSLKNSGMVTSEIKAMQVSISVISQKYCLRSHSDFRSIINDKTFCAGSRDMTGFCNGASGSGFIIKRFDQWTLRGIVSSSIRDDEKSICYMTKFVIFTDTSKFQNWLRSIIY